VRIKSLPKRFRRRKEEIKNVEKFSGKLIEEHFV